jgi:hypothetical protein
VRSPTRRTSVSKSRLAMSLRPDRQLEAGPPGGPRAATGGFATRPTQALRDRADICRQGGDVGPGLQARDEAANVVMDCTQAIDDPRVNVVLGERRMRWGASNRSTSTPTTRQQSASRCPARRHGLPRRHWRGWRLGGLRAGPAVGASVGRQWARVVGAGFFWRPDHGAVVNVDRRS